MSQLVCESVIIVVEPRRLDATGSHVSSLSENTMRYSFRSDCGPLQPDDDCITRLDCKGATELLQDSFAWETRVLTRDGFCLDHGT